MRSFFLIVPIGLLPALAMAQTPAPPKTPAPPGVQAPAAPEDEEHAALPTTYGWLDYGGRWTHLDGDGARYERYRDMGDGVLLDSARLSTQQWGWQLDFAPDHMGRRDQRYAGSAIRPGQFKVWGVWDQIPMLMSRTTRTLFAVTAPDELQIENTIQSQVQTQASYLATALQLARTFELSSRRHLFEGGAEYIAKSGLTLSTNVRRIDRDGAIPFGGSFGHGQVVETMAPVEHKLTDVESSAEYVRGNLLARGGYTGSWFHNENTSLTFDNPFRVTDSTSGGMRGRTSLAPNNSFIGINGVLSYRLPRRSRVSIYGALGSLRDADAPLLPFTINAAVISPPLDRTETEGHAKTSSMNLSFTSRPLSTVGVDLRFRTYHYDNLTPEFLVTQRVAYDNAVSNVTNTALQRTEAFGVKRSAFDADVRFNPIRALSGGLGFSHAAEERTHRIFEESTENTYRVLVDSVGNRWFTLRSKYEHSERRGEGDATAIAAELLAIGEQPGMRHFDIASRDRDRVTLTGGVVPFNTVSFNASFAAGKDDYLETLFGLLDNHHRVYSAGVEYAPSEYAAAGLSYSFERYTSLSRSRQASNTAEFNNPARNWTANTLDRAHSIIAHGEILQFRQHLDVMLFADYNRANGLYRYGTGSVPDRTLPEEVEVPTSLADPTQLPPLRSELARGNVDLVYSLTERWGLGFSVWYEHYRVKDFSLDADALSRLDPAGALLLGYQYLPYTATTFWGRVKYKF